jgi:hypothetical protein
MISTEEAKETRMTERLSTTVRNTGEVASNQENMKIILRFFEFMKKNGTSERYQTNNTKP